MSESMETKRRRRAGQWRISSVCPGCGLVLIGNFAPYNHYRAHRDHNPRWLGLRLARQAYEAGQINREAYLGVLTGRYPLPTDETGERDG